MPILEVEIVARPGEIIKENLVNHIADLAGEIFQSPPGRTWVRLRVLPAEHYAENGGGPPEGVYPVFVSLLKSQWPSQAQMAEEISSLTSALARVCERPQENVHVLYLPAAAGRTAFGGRLVP
jgi:phenylpyruvate tautomerase PptA (4-oxalocrotonate tautomerase family)